MSDVLIPWENRIFRVDRECYLLFLGNDEWDVKPFVRIGNSSWLNEEILELISHTVITESFTGNPLNEVALSQIYKGLYLGEPGIVEVILSFFDSFQSEHSDVVSYEEQEEREGKDHVYFYNSGNITVTYENQRIFDLHKREKEDRHYNVYCSEIMDIFRKNPLRWETHDITGKGFLFTDKNQFFFDNDKLLGIRWEKHYFKDLAEAGWNPDKMKSMIIDLKSENIDESKSAAFINYIKRGLSTKQPMEIYSRNESFRRKIEPLFEYIRAKGCPLESSMLSEQDHFSWYNTECFYNGGSFTFLLSDSVQAVVSDNKQMTLYFDNKKYVYDLPTDVPSLIHWNDSGIQTLCKKYVVDLSSKLLKNSSTNNISNFIKDVSGTTASLIDMIIEKGKPIKQRNNFNSIVKKAIRSMGDDYDGKVTLLAINCASLLKTASEEKSEYSNKALELSDLLLKTFPVPKKQAVDFLFTANYYENGRYYLPYKFNISSDDKMNSSAMRDALIQCDKKEVDFFFSERERLKALLDSLRAGTLWDDIKSHEKENHNSKKKNKEQDISHNHEIKESSIPSTTSNIQRSNNSGKRNGKGVNLRKILLILLILALICATFLGLNQLKGISIPFPTFNWLKKEKEIEKVEEKKIPVEIEKVIIPIVPKPFNPERDIDKLTIDNIQITQADVHLMANQIAVRNGYRDLGFHEVDGKDPTIIEPGLELIIPGFESHVVVDGDTIWYLGAFFLVKELAEDIERFNSLSLRYEEAKSMSDSVDSIIISIKNLGENSNCENFRKKIEKWLM